MSAEEDSDDGDKNPILMIFPDEQEDTEALSTLHDYAEKEQLQHHYFRSINSPVVIRQLRSQGLSFQLWPAATALVTLLDEYRSHPTNSPLSPTISGLSDGPDRRQLNILEIGSGTGLVGIAAAVTLGAKVTVTDLPHVISNLQFNVDLNKEILASHGGSVKVAPLSWGEADDVVRIGREFDLVLASDVVYHDHLYEPLLQTLQGLIFGPGGNAKMVFVMAHLRRWKKDSSFFKKAKKLFGVEVLHVDKPAEGCRIGVVVYRFGVKRR